MRALYKAGLTGNDCLPVDTHNASLIAVDDLPSLNNLKKRDLVDKKGKRKVSYQLRYLFLALDAWCSSQPGHVMTFATVHFSLPVEVKLMRASKGPAAAYGNQLRDALKELSHPSNFFLVLENGTSDSKRLHAHIVIACHPDDAAALKKNLKRSASPTSTGVHIQQTYTLRHTPAPGSFEEAAMELDFEHKMNSYSRGEKSGEYIQSLPVNIGVADYISKDLAKNMVRFKGRPFYAVRELVQAANSMYDTAYRKQRELKAKNVN